MLETKKSNGNIGGLVKMPLDQTCLSVLKGEELRHCNNCRFKERQGDCIKGIDIFDTDNMFCDLHAFQRKMIHAVARKQSLTFIFSIDYLGKPAGFKEVHVITFRKGAI